VAERFVRGSTKKTGVIGWPVEGSLSPAIHNAAFAALGLDWVYLPLPVPPGEVADALGGLPALGFVGANVTMPHKTEVAALIDNLSEDAARLQAVNTIAVEASGLAGHNTDAPGFDRFLRFDAGFDPRDRTALLFGAGGAARACALALARAGLATVVVAARSEGQVDALRAALDGFETAVREVAFDGAGEVGMDLVVNATPVGAAGEELPLPPLGAGSTVVDLLYRPALTPLLARAKAAGAAAFGGLGLLVRQAALSFELWTDLAAPLPVMSAAALSELAKTSS
jgi:shikimate dehydrogenase